MCRVSVRLCLVAVGMVVLGCSDKPILGGPQPGSPQVASVEKYAGDSQTTTVNSPVAIRPAVRVTGSVGQPIEGVPVSFSVWFGAGSLTGEDMTTDQYGVATLGGWVLGTKSGLNSLRVTVADTLILSFTATGTPGSPAALTAATATSMTGTVGAPLAAHPTVRVADGFGNPVAGAAVTFQVTSGGGSATGIPDSTNALGLAVLGTWTLGTVAGDNTLQVRAPGLTPVSFLAKGTAAAPLTITKIAGDSQLAGLQVPVRTSPTVQVRDAYGNPVGGATVRFSVASGGGNVTDSLRETDSTGAAQVGAWTLGSTPGPNTLRASIAGGPSATFMADAVDMCTDTSAYVIGSTINDSLTTNSCTSGGQYTNRYAMLVGTRASLRFDMSSPAYSSHVSIFDAGGTEIATTPDYCPNTGECLGTNSVQVLLAPGTYLAGAGGYTYDYDDFVVGGVVGPYTFASTTAPEALNGCAHDPVVYITPGVTTAQRVDSTDCWMLFRSYRYYYDQINIYMTLGKTYTISMTSGDFDTYLELYASDYYDGYYIVAYNDDVGGSSNSQITFTPSWSGVYSIQPETYDGNKTGAYTLSVSVTDAAAAATPAATMTTPGRTAVRAAPAFHPRPPKPQ